MTPPSLPPRPPKKQDRPLALVNARIVDPASNRDETGGVLVENGIISAIGSQVTRASVSGDAEIHDCHGRVLAPGLIDMRVQLREPGEEHMESIESGGALACECGTRYGLEPRVTGAGLTVRQ